jgi:hypothetical protein
MVIEATPGEISSEVAEGVEVWVFSPDFLPNQLYSPVFISKLGNLGACPLCWLEAYDDTVESFVRGALTPGCIFTGIGSVSCRKTGPEGGGGGDGICALTGPAR